MLERFGEDARRVVEQADAEARRMGHRRVGTEHLLIGLLAQPGTPAADALVAAGATLIAVREKVVEALASRTEGAPLPGNPDLPFTDRAGRALERAGRLSLRLRRDIVEPEHILVSLLDVEGTSGQVLRGLAVDPEAVKARLASLIGASPAQAPRAAVVAEVDDPAGPCCPTCRHLLEGAIGCREISATRRQGRPDRSVEIFFCTTCGTAIGLR